MPASTQLPNLRPGDSVAGRFRIVELIGKGGFSVVFRAYQENMKRFVALKVLKPSISNDERVVERFRREALFASHLSHPNTITLFDYGRTESGLCYIAMEYLEGTELGAVIRSEDGLELSRVWSILAQASQSLAEAHRLGLIHRDIKPENIYLVQQDRDELVKVLDFGLSKAFRTITDDSSGQMTPLTQEGKVFGTPLYMAPEQAMDKPISPAIDVYALGHIAYAMITGAPRYGDMSTAMDIMLRQIYDPPLELPEPFRDTPFAALVEGCTRKDPSERIPDADALYDELVSEDFADHIPPGPLRERLTERSAAHKNWSGGLDAESSFIENPETLSFDRERGLLHEILDEVRARGEMRIALINGPRGGGRTQLLHRFLDDVRERGDVALVHRQSFRDGEFQDRGLAADIARLKQPTGGTSLDEGVLPMLGTDSDPETNDEFSHRESSFFGNLDGKRETMLSKTGRLFRDVTSETPIVWALERLERIDAFTLAFLNWFFQDLQTRPAPVMIVATVSRSDLVDRAGLLRYTQAILGTAEPTVRRFFIARTSGRQTAVEPEVEDISDTLSGTDQMPVPDAIRTAKGGDEFTGEELPGDESADTLRGTDRAQPENELRSLFDKVLGLLAQLGDEIPVDIWEQVRDALLDDYDTPNLRFILDRAEQFGIVEREDDLLSFGRPNFADQLREQLDKDDAFATETRRTLAEALLQGSGDASREQVELAVHHFLQGDHLADAIETLNTAGNEAFEKLDLDAAREFYLRLQRIFEQADDSDLDAVRGDIEADPARIWLRIGEIHGALDEHGAAEDALERAADYAETRAPALRGRALKLLADIQSAQKRYVSAERNYDRARAAYESAGIDAGAAASASLMAETLLQQGEFEKAGEELEGVIRACATLDLPLVAARSNFRLGRALVHLAKFEEAFEHLEGAAESFEALDRPDEAMHALCTYGDAAYAEEQFDLARSCFSRARDHSAQTRNFGENFPTLGLARAFAAVGRFDAAADCIDDKEAADRQARSPVSEAQWALHRADLFLVHEAHPAAQANYADMQNRAREIGRTDLVMAALVRRAFSHFHAIEYEEAADHFEHASELAKEYGSHEQYILTRASALYLEFASREFPAESDELAEQLEKAVDGEFAWARTVCATYLADVRAANAAWGPARELLQRARRAAAEAGRIRALAAIRHRLERLRAIERDEEPPEMEGALIGGPMPPEIRIVRADAIYSVGD